MWEDPFKIGEQGMCGGPAPMTIEERLAELEKIARKCHGLCERVQAIEEKLGTSQYMSASEKRRWELENIVDKIKAVVS